MSLEFNLNSEDNFEAHDLDYHNELFQIGVLPDKRQIFWSNNNIYTKLNGCLDEESKHIPYFGYYPALWDLSDFIIFVTWHCFAQTLEAATYFIIEDDYENKIEDNVHKTATSPSTANLWANSKNDKSKSSNGQMESKSAPKATNSNEDISACLNSVNFDINPSLTKWDESSSEDESKSSPKHDQKKYSKKSKTTEFAYLLERKAFRMMRKYYKEKFEFEVDIAEYKKSLPLMTSEEFNEHVCKFI